MHGGGLAVLPEPWAAMKGSDADALPPLGEKVERPKPAEPAPQWKPLRPGYETDGSAVRRVPEGNAMNPWSKYMKDLGRTSP